MAEANSLQAKTIKSGKTERTANYSEQSIEMSLSGDFTGFYLFMQQLEKLPRLMRVTDMTLTKISDHDGQMQATLSLNIFFEARPTDADRRGDCNRTRECGHGISRANKHHTERI